MLGSILTTGRSVFGPGSSSSASGVATSDGSESTIPLLERSLDGGEAGLPFDFRSFSPLAPPPPAYRLKTWAFVGALVLLSINLKFSVETLGRKPITIHWPDLTEAISPPPLFPIQNSVDCQYPFDQPKPTLNHSRLAVLVESRNQPHLIPSLLHFLTLVPPEWPFLVLHSPINAPALRNSRPLRPYLDAGKLSLQLLPDSLRSNEDFFKLMTSLKLYEELLPEEAESLLVFQTDSMMCSKAKQTVNDFLGFEEHDGGYDWVGAPWVWRNYPSDPFGGNGGLSLRRKSTMISIIKEYGDSWAGEAEDLWFSERIAWTTNRFPTIEVAARFSYENPPTDLNADWVYEPLGLHVKGDWWPPCIQRDEEKLKKLLDWCPDLTLILRKECIL